MHYWTGTAWYLYLIIQPYFATHSQLEKHCTNGIIGMALFAASRFGRLKHPATYLAVGVNLFIFFSNR